MLNASVLTRRRSPNLLPVMDGLVARFSADEIPPQTDNTSLHRWVDSHNRIPASFVRGTAPKYRTAQIGSKPSVRFSGGGLEIQNPGPIKTAIDSQNNTVFAVFRTVSSATLGNLISCAGGSPSFSLLADGTNVGRNAAGLIGQVPYAGQTSFSTVAATSFKNYTQTYSSGNGGLSYQGVFVNGCQVGASPTVGQDSQGYTLTIGSNSTNSFPVSADIFDILIFNRPLFPPDMLKLEMWACDKYVQSYPWAAMSRVPVFFGDSQTAGVGASSIATSAAYLAAQTLTLSLGQWMNCAVPGIQKANMNLLAPNWIDPIPATIGKEIGLIGFEWYNTKDSTTTGGNTYLAARKAVPNIKTVWGTSLSSSFGGTGDPYTPRDNYDAAWNALTPKTYIDSYMDFRADTHVGASGSYATYSSAGDGVHLPDATQPYLAALLAAGYSAIP